MAKQNEIQKQQHNDNIEIFNLIRTWAKNKGIYESGDLKTQVLKLMEETGELAKAVINEDEQEVIDAIGDCVVVLTNVAELANEKFYKTRCNFCSCNSNSLCMEITLENCVGSSYDTIKNRKGKMLNNSFVKES